MPIAPSETLARALHPNPDLSYFLLKADSDLSDLAHQINVVKLLGVELPELVRKHALLMTNDREHADVAAAIAPGFHGTFAELIDVAAAVIAPAS